MLLLYIVCNFLFGYTLKKKKILINNVFPYIFWGFLILYPCSLYSVFLLGGGSIVPEMMSYYFENDIIINEILLISSFALLTFTICLILFPPCNETNNYKKISSIKLYKQLFWLFFPIALYLNSISNWTSGERVGLIPSLAAYTRNILTVLAIVLFIPRYIGLKNKLIYLALIMIITYVSTQRTNALIVIIAFVYTMTSSKNAFKYLAIGLISLLALGSIRNGVNAYNLIYPLLGEGLFGSWGVLQAVDITNNDGYSYSRLFMLFNDTINWFLQLLHMPAFLPSLGEVVTNTGETYYPMGGFFFLSDAYAVLCIIPSCSVNQIHHRTAKSFTLCQCCL